MSVLLLDGDRNGDYTTVEDAFASGYVFDEPTSAAWAAVGETGDVMIPAPVARLEEVARFFGGEGYVESLAFIEFEDAQAA